MKRCAKILSALIALLLVLSLAACGGQSGSQTTTPTETSSAPETQETTEPIDAGALYSDALDALYAGSNRVLTIDYQESRLVGGETYTESSAITASYAGLTGDGEMEALVTETVTFGTYEIQYIQSYMGGTAYCRVNNQNFFCDMDADAFTQAQLPAALLDADAYSELSCEIQEDGSLAVYFRDAAVLESWVPARESAQLTEAYGTAVLDAAGTLLSTAYHARYTVSTAEYTLDVTVAVDTPDTLDLSAQQPVYPESCPELADLTIPRLLLKVVGDVYTSQSMSVSYTDTLYSEAFALIRSESGEYITHGSEDSFAATIATQVSLTDYTGTAVTNEQVISYADGVYSYCFNGSEYTTVDNVTVQQVRNGCEDAILASLFNLEFISKATVTDTGDFLYIRFTGNEDFSESLCDSIYALLEMDLDGYAASYDTDSAGGYLAINKYTALPTALGMYIERRHSIDGVDYLLSYQLDQSMTLSCADAAERLGVESAGVTAESPTPLFYQVTGSNGQTLWLLGTIHVGDDRTAVLPDSITGALTASDALAVEYNIVSFEDTVANDPALQAQLAENYYYSDGSTISDHLTSKQYKKADRLIHAAGCNSVNSPYMKVSIWNNVIENLYIRQGSALSASKGVDRRLITIATQEQLPVYEIESGLSQIRLLTSLSEDVQAWLLKDTMESGMLEYCQELEKLYELWCWGNEEALTEMLTHDSGELSGEELDYYTALITDRNASMLETAKEYLESGETVFFAVGLAHLLGEDGLVQQLRDAGYTVELVS